MIRLVAAALMFSTMLGTSLQTGIAPDRIHATLGIVKSITKTALVVDRLKNRGNISFTLNGSTNLDGKIIVGSLVSVRYYDEGKAHVATAVAAQPKN